MQLAPSRLLAALAYPRTLDDWAELVVPWHSSREIRARVVARRAETADTTTLVLRPNDLWQGHRAGQHVALTAEIAGVRKTRFFSIASGEGEPLVRVTIKARPGGEVTPTLISRIERGAVLTLSPAKGDFVLPPRLPAQILLASGGSGITPVMSMLRTLVRGGHRGEVVFAHWARSREEVIFREELEELALTGPANFRVAVHTGPLADVHVDALVQAHAPVPVWGCGPTPFLEALEHALARRGLAENLQVERFSALEPPRRTADRGTVTFARSGVARGAEPGAPLLVVAERAGLSPASGCRMGICKSCTCRKVSGTTRDLTTGRLSSDADVDIQPCVSAAVGPVTLDL